ncbi:MAG: tRNA (adenosine(37)-N6)-threonylcarbamoyltransferase complex dimerization subunit type 1 TsaB [Rhizobiales bacterium]|nr:tRNA (adenosine(37)-N6)-threonylcarbamoyltransferase complex dimerization subunit type 1 TsaB [Hyphomicrobiales bacterium]
MKLLALDTAMAACSVAVHQSGDVLAEAFVAMDRGHAEAIAPMVRDVMAKARLEFAALDRIVVTVGPGTFTGVRIGLAMARGLGLALDIPVIGIDTLSAIAANAPATDTPLFVAADARRDEVYGALFASGKMLRAPAVLSMKACLQLLPEGPVHVLGTGADAVIAASTRDDLTRNRAGDLPDAAKFGSHGFDLVPSKAMPTPLYLRAPDAKPQKTGAITVRAATAPEAGIFAALHAECFDSPWGAEEFAKLMAMPGATATLAFEAREPVGFILVRKAADEAEIVTLGTRPFARRRGVAAALVSHQFTEFKSSSVKACFIEVAASNGDARALYSSCGFIEAGRRRGYYERTGGALEDAIVMRKELAP